MRIFGTEVVRRYHIRFEPRETKILLEHPDWQGLISVKSINGNPRRDLWGHATLSKNQINAVCDVLGINGREFMVSLESQRGMENVTSLRGEGAG